MFQLLWTVFKGSTCPKNTEALLNSCRPFLNQPIKIVKFVNSGHFVQARCFLKLLSSIFGFQSLYQSKNRKLIQHGQRKAQVTSDKNFCVHQVHMYNRQLKERATYDENVPSRFCRQFSIIPSRLACKTCTSPEIKLIYVSSF